MPEALGAQRQLIRDEEDEGAVRLRILSLIVHKVLLINFTDPTPAELFAVSFQSVL